MLSVFGFIAVSALLSIGWGQADKPLRLGVIGVSHGHVWEVFSRIGRGDFVVVGVAERNDEIRRQSNLHQKLDDKLFYANIEQMLDETKPEAVIVYEPIYEHLNVVKVCAPRGIHVMVEKPLAVNMEHATQMAELARKHGILLLTNYETTWYNTNREAFRLVQEGTVGEVNRINVYDGHQGPVEIGCGKEFLNWLTDPVLNGGGAVIDFGCYGANLATWLLPGQKPLSVYAVLKQNKPAIYPNVDDDATIIVNYPNTVVQIMASWNWPMGRKDMHIYGSKGYIYQDTPTRMRVRTGKEEVAQTPQPLAPPYNDAFLYLKAAVRKEIQVAPGDLSSLENNLQVVRILDAAVRSGKTGEVIRF